MSLLRSGYYAVPDPANPATMTYWRVSKDGGAATPWPRHTSYGPVFLRKDTPPKSDRDAFIAYAKKANETVARWRMSVHLALTADPDAARGKFAALTTRCCECGRVLVDAASKVNGIGPDCRAGVPEDVLAAIAASVATAHAGAAS